MSKAVTTIELNDIARWLYESCFYESFYGKVFWGSKMKGIAGNCDSNGVIMINKNYYLQYGLEDTLDILKHELAHLHCFKKKGTHSDDDSFFLEDLKKIGGILKAKRIPQQFYIYECQECERKWYFEKKLDKSMFCKNCLQEIKFKEIRELY